MIETTIEGDLRGAGGAAAGSGETAASAPG
jgi:hypothetical protein